MHLPNLRPDMDLAARLFAELKSRTADGAGVTRDAYGAGEATAHALVRAEAETIGLDTVPDHAGNLFMTLPGRDRAAPRIILGSHLDSVREGGNFDGAAGVLAGLAAVAGMRRAGFVPERDITVTAIRAEEAGAWFPASYPGSRAALGTLPAELLAIRRQDTGRTLEDHMTEAGFDPQGVRDRKRSVGDVAAFLEVHIEQGPVLDEERIPVGIVTGIPGSRRFREGRVLGEWSHSGAVPRKYRRDAGAAMAEIAYRLDQAWGVLDAAGQPMVCTFCVMGTTAEAGFTKIPGEAQFQLDIRAVDMANVDSLVDSLHRIVAEVEASRGVRVVPGPETGSTPSPMDAGIQAGLTAAAQTLGIGHRSMPSGGGHDAAAFAQAGIPAGMLFVRNQNGSHNPHEAMRMEDYEQACAIALHWAATASS